jgi:protein phosphatase
MVELASAAITSAGKVRAVNQDALVERYPVFIVADGMGGHDAGEIASAVVAEEMKALTTLGQPDVAAVKETIAAAARRIQRIGARDRRHAAGTTLTGVVVVSRNNAPYWLVVNVGDSRTYRLERGRLEQLSHDHSEVQELVDRGRISPAAARHHPRRSVVTRVLGAPGQDEPDYWLLPIEDGDRILVCSDGLTAGVPDAAIAAALRALSEPRSAVEALMTAALAAGGRDNISIIVVDAHLPGGSDEPDTANTACNPMTETRPNPKIERSRL